MSTWIFSRTVGENRASALQPARPARRARLHSLALGRSQARIGPGQFHLRSIWERLETHGDLFAETLEKRQRLEPALERLQAALEGTTSVARGSRKV